MLDQLGINRVLLNKKRPPLYAFGGTQVQPLSNIHLALTKGECPHKVTTVANVVVVDCSTTYNVILGQPALTELDVSISYYTLMLTFRTPHEIWII